MLGFLVRGNFQPCAEFERETEKNLCIVSDFLVRTEHVRLSTEVRKRRDVSLLSNFHRQVRNNNVSHSEFYW